MQLWNTLSKEELVKKLNESGHEFVTVSFYHYVQIPNPQLFRDHLFGQWSKIDVVGRTYVAHEGINAQISVPVTHIGRYSDELNDIEI